MAPAAQSGLEEGRAGTGLGAGWTEVLTQNDPSGEPILVLELNVSASYISISRLDLEKSGVSKTIRARYGPWGNKSHISNLLHLPTMSEALQ